MLYVEEKNIMHRISLGVPEQKKSGNLIYRIKKAGAK